MTGELRAKIRNYLVCLASDAGAPADTRDRYPPTDAIGISVKLARRVIFLGVDAVFAMRRGHIEFIGENVKATLVDGRQVVGPRALYVLGYRYGRPLYRMATGDEVERDSDMRYW
jgi:hypothetical protein